LLHCKPVAPPAFHPAVTDRGKCYGAQKILRQRWFEAGKQGKCPARADA
jgi:hypothetical protein